MALLKGTIIERASIPKGPPNPNSHTLKSTTKGYSESFVEVWGSGFWKRAPIKKRRASDKGYSEGFF